MENKDFYEVLGVAETVGPKDIKDAYRSLALKNHPDRNEARADAVDAMKAINEAYAVLSNPDKRREYDALRHQFGSSAYGRFRQNYSEQDIFKGSDIHRVFEEMARSVGIRGFDEIFKEFYGQGYRTFEVNRPGVFLKGFVFSGLMNPGGMRTPLNGGVGSALKFLLNRFGGLQLPEKGKDSYDVISLQPESAHRGGPYAYFHRKKSKKLVVQVPPGVKDGQKIRLAGMGEDGRGGTMPGDLFLTVSVKTPLLQSVKKFFRLGS